MIYYSENTTLNLAVGDGLQLDSSGNIAPHTTGECIGFVRAVTALDNGESLIQIYVAGGGGADMRLGAAWDGALTRFEVQSGSVHPVASGGIGWLIPSYPRAGAVVGAIVQGAIYSR
jgi:hypothetical protein